MTPEEIRKTLEGLAEPGYRDFQCGLMPNVPRERVLGVRTPILRDLATKLVKSGDFSPFLDDLPHRYYEENNLHSFIISKEKDYDAALARVEKFLPEVDNWATCDGLSPRAFAKNKTRLFSDAKRWCRSGAVYTVRFGIEMLMSHFLDEDFTPEVLAVVAAVESDEYYINMMIAWFFATALAKQYDAALPYLTEYRLAPWVHNKTISKAHDSYRITAEQKAYLSTLRVDAKRQLSREILRKATERDLSAVAELYHEGARAEGSTWDEEYPTRADAENDLRDGGLFVFVRGGEVIGAVSVVGEEELAGAGAPFTEGRHAEIARLVIAQRERGHRLGVTILRALFSRLAGEGVRFVRLLVSPTNPGAKGTYDALGFTYFDEIFAWGHTFLPAEKEISEFL